jgi:hypothetical protein
MTDRELMQMALDALDTLGAGTSYKTHNTAKALRDRLAQPEWVGLTDEEIKDFIATFPIIFTPDDLVIFARAILRKASEK